jgi:hypothetical protein
MIEGACRFFGLSTFSWLSKGTSPRAIDWDTPDEKFIDLCLIICPTTPEPLWLKGSLGAIIGWHKLLLYLG